MKRSELAQALMRQTEDVRVSPQLRQRTLDAIYGKEKRIMKKKIPAALLAAALSLLFCAAALAAAGLSGMLDYYSIFFDKSIPENAPDFIEKDMLETSDELVNISLRELYYDGKTARMTVDVTAADEKTFLVGFDTESGETLSFINRMNPQFNADDPRTIAELYTEEGYTASYSVSAGLNDPEGKTHGGSKDYSYTAPGVLTLFIEQSFEDDLPEREVLFSVTLTPFLDPEGNPVEWDPNARIRITDPLMLSSSTGEETAYVNIAPAVFPETGVTIEQLQVIPKPHELLVRLYYTVGDSEIGNQPAFGNEEKYGQLKEYFQLEFIDPDSSAEEPFNQRLSFGLSDSRGQLLSEEGETPIRMLYELSLGRNELHDEYTVRVFDLADKTRYDSVTIPVREATEADLAAFPAR